MQKVFFPYLFFCTHVFVVSTHVWAHVYGRVLMQMWVEVKDQGRESPSAALALSAEAWSQWNPEFPDSASLAG